MDAPFMLDRAPAEKLGHPSPHPGGLAARRSPVTKLFAVNDATDHHRGNAACPACSEGYPETCPCSGLMHGEITEDTRAGTTMGDYGVRAVRAFRGGRGGGARPRADCLAREHPQHSRRGEPMTICICGHSEKDHSLAGTCRVAGCPCEHFEPVPEIAGSEATLGLRQAATPEPSTILPTSRIDEVRLFALF
jgi:hypothetical protein